MGRGLRSVNSELRTTASNATVAWFNWLALDRHFAVIVAFAEVALASHHFAHRHLQRPYVSFLSGLPLIASPCSEKLKKV